MSESNRPNDNRPSDADKTQRGDSGQPVAGRSATVAEIGRELGDLDFEPDDLLASLRPFEPAPNAAAEADSSGADLSAPRLPGITAAPSTLDGPAQADESLDDLEGQAFSADEVATRTLLPDEPTSAAPSSALGVEPTNPSEAELSAATTTVLPDEPTSFPRSLRVEPMAFSGDSTPVAPTTATRLEHEQRIKQPPRPQLPEPPPKASFGPPSRPLPRANLDHPTGSEAGTNVDVSGQPSSSAVGPSHLGGPDPTAPDVTASEEAVVLEELVALPPERPEPLSFPLERPAFEHLRERGLIDNYHALAVVLTREAQAQRHPHEQAELAFVNSELLSMIGELETAREYLHALTPVTTPVNSLQARQLAYCAQDYTSYLQLLKTELRSQISHESRRHLMALCADAIRVYSPNEAESRRHLELSLRAFPSDPRFVLQRLATQLGEHSGIAKRRTQSIPDSPRLSDALRDLMALRSGAPKNGECAHPAGPLMVARAAWQKRDFEKVLGALDDLGSNAELSQGASWLYACLTALNPRYRQSGSAHLDPMVEGGDVEAELALLERRLHATTDVPTSVEAFSFRALASLSAMDRLSLGIAVDAHPDTLRVLAEEVRNEPTARPLVRAIHSTLLVEEPANDEVPAQIRWGIGTLLGALDGSGVVGDDGSPTEGHTGSRPPEVTPKSHLTGAVESLLRASEAVDPDYEVVRALRLLSALHRCDPAELARHLVGLSPMLDDSDEAPILVLAAQLARLAGDREFEKAALTQAISKNPRLECARRAIFELRSDASRPDASRPDASRPDASRPDASQPDTSRPEVSPDASPPSTSRPDVSLIVLAEAMEPSARRGLLELESHLLRQAPPDASLAPPLAQIVAGLPELAPLVQMLQLSGSASASPDDTVVDTNAESEAARTFGELIRALQEYARNGTATLSNVVGRRAAGDDVHAYTLIGSLDEALPPLDPESMELGEDLRDWLRAEAAARSPIGKTPELDAAGLRASAERLSSPVLRTWADRCDAMRGGDLAVFEERMARASLATNDSEYVDSVLESIEIDPEFEQTVGSIECARRVLERQPDHLAALRTSLRHSAVHEDFHHVGRLAARLAPQLDPVEQQAHAWLAIVSTTYANDTDADTEQANHLDRLAAQGDTIPIWACRKVLGLAQARRDDERIFECVNRLRESSSRALDAATLTLRAAEAASRLERWDTVGHLLDRAVELYPEHLVALSMRAEFLESRGDLARAASAFDTLGETACMPAHKVAAWVHAASLYRESSEQVDGIGRAVLALERAIDLDPMHTEAAMQLRELYMLRGELGKLEQLLTCQLLRVEGVEERARIEFERAKTLMELERLDEAESGLERTLSLIPGHEPALILTARLKQDRGDFEGAEQQLLRLAALSEDPKTQVDAYRQLATLYETELEQPARAEIAYREILQRDPDDPCADRLIQLLLRLGNADAAVELLRQAIERTSDPIRQRHYNLELARVMDEILGDRRSAEETLEKARRRWPNDAATIEALAAFYRRGKDQAALTTLLDRSVVDARRALGQGRFEAAFFEVIASVAELRDETDLGRVARATVAALNAQPAALPGVGTRAADELYADLLAPDVLSLPMRAMLRKSGWAMCSAHPIDVRTLRATPLSQTEPALSEHLRELARSFGIYELDLHLSPALGAVCQPTSSVPATLVVGPEFAALRDEGVRDALAIRALRILSANAAALANTAPVDLWPLLIAYLSSYLPDWLPPGIDPQKVAPLRQRIRNVLPTNTDPDLPLLAADVAASIGNRASQLGIAVQQWGSRTALLALGDPSLVLSAIAAAAGQLDRLSSNPVDRQKWIVRNPEARDLAIFSVSAQYVEARAKAIGRD